MDMVAVACLEALIEVAEEPELARAEAAVKARRAQLARERSFVIRPGMTVRFADRIRPAYLAGLRAEVLEGQTGRTKVRLRVIPDDAHRAGRFRYGSLNCPISLVEVA